MLDLRSFKRNRVPYPFDILREFEPLEEASDDLWRSPVGGIDGSCVALSLHDAPPWQALFHTSVPRRADTCVLSLTEWDEYVKSFEFFFDSVRVCARKFPCCIFFPLQTMIFPFFVLADALFHTKKKKLSPSFLHSDGLPIRVSVGFALGREDDIAAVHELFPDDFAPPPSKALSSKNRGVCLCMNPNTFFSNILSCHAIPDRFSSSSPPHSFLTPLSS